MLFCLKNKAAIFIQSFIKIEAALTNNAN